MCNTNDTSIDEIIEYYKNEILEILNIVSKMMIIIL
mgnify:CR=1 FL=1